MPITITPLAAADIDAVATLARRVWQATYATIISQQQIDYMLGERYASARMRAEIAAPDVCWDVARVDGEIVAFASTLLGAKSGEMKLDKLYVDPQRQRAGIGGALIAHVAARAREHGCATLILAVNKNNERAIAAYRKHGFAVRESVRVDIGHGFVMDDFIMALTL